MAAARIISQRYDEHVPIDSIAPHPRNPRVGNVDAIAESIQENGFYGSLKVQESTRLIIGGNHSWKAAKQVNLSDVPVTFIDCDDATALRILAVDNRTQDLASYDDLALAQLLDELSHEKGGLAGSGYSDEDFEALITDLGDDWIAAAGGDTSSTSAEDDIAAATGTLGKPARTRQPSIAAHAANDAPGEDDGDDGEDEGEDEELPQGLTSPGKPYKNQYAVAVMCENDVEQQEVYDKLIAMGYTCKVLVV